MTTEYESQTQPTVAREGGSTERGTGAAAPKRILLADDSPQIRVSLSKLLRNAGYHVTSVANGNEVLDRTDAEHFDLLILDLNMPGMDGWKTLGHLIQVRSTLPVLVVTAQPGQREWAEAEGALGFMEKPLDLPGLLNTLAEMISRPRSSVGAPGRDRTPLRCPGPEAPAFSFSEPQRRWARG